MKNKITTTLLITIVLTLISVINSKAYYITDWVNPTKVKLSNGDEIEETPELAYEAKVNVNNFLDTPSSNLYNKTLSRTSNFYHYTIWYSNATCMYHRESDIVSKAQIDVISDVLDFKFDPTFSYNYCIYNNNLDNMNNKFDINSDLKGALIYSMKLAYDNHAQQGINTTTEKKAVNYFFNNLFKNTNRVTNDYFTNGINSSITSTNDFSYIYTNAMEYSGNINTYKALNKAETPIESTVDLKNKLINNDGSLLENTKVSIFGPFNIISGDTIKTINLWDNEQTISTDGYKMYISSDGATWNQYTKGSIPNQNNFYIAIPYDYTKHSNIKINFVQESMEYTDARMILMLNPSCNGQQLGLYAYRNNYTNNQLTYDIKIPENNILKVVKSAENEAGTRQSGVGFIIYKENENDGKPYGYLRYFGSNLQIKTGELAGCLTGKLEYDNSSSQWGFYDDTTNASREAATVFVTGNTSDGWNGYFQISNLPSGTYYIGEVFNYSKNSEGVKDYKSSILYNYTLQVGEEGSSEVIYDGIKRSSSNLSKYSSDMNYMQTITIELNSGKTTRVGIVDKKIDKAVLNITKKNKNTLGKEVEFQIINKSTGKYIVKHNGVFELQNKQDITADMESTFITNNNGDLVDSKGNTQIEVPEEGNYQIIETKNPHYEVNIKTVKVTPSTSTYAINAYDKVTISNIKKGNIYTIEIVDNNGNTPSYGGGNITIAGRVWIDKPDETKGGIYDDLYSSGEETISGVQVYLVSKLNSTRYGDVYTTNSNGQYSFSVNSGLDLSGYYLKFKCPGSYSGYSSVPSKYNKNDGSKVSTYTNGIATTYIGTDSNQEKIYGLSGIYENGMINNINLGLIEIQPGQDMSINIANVKIDFNDDYTYTYEYGGQGNVVNSNVPTVSWGSTEGYTRPIYPSEVLYNKIYSNTLKAYVTYRIDIQNTTTTSTNEYTEISMKVNSLTTTYNKDKYELVEDTNWHGNNGEATYSNTFYVDKGSNYNPILITFKLQNSEFTSILNDGGVVENLNSEMKTEHYYKKYEMTGTRTVTNEDGSSYEEEIWEWVNYGPTQEASTPRTAPNFIFKMGDRDRILSGTVFEDTNANETGRENQLIGNSKYDNGQEGLVQNVKVELLNEDNENVTLYTKDNPNGKLATGEYSEEYQFTGVLPGEYYVRFTYADGSQKIKEVDGTEINIYSSQYKSTIINESNPSHYIFKGMDNYRKWYLENDEGYSTAIDDINKRLYTNNTYGYGSLNTKTGASDLSNKTMQADTPRFSIGIEYTTSTTGNYNTSKPSFDKMNFGIIKMPVVSLNIYKKISYVSITLSNGQVITQGDPSTATSNIPYISTLDVNDSYGFGRGGYVKAELDTQYLYGSTLQVTYEIKVLNTSDINYKTEGYYKYGEKGSVEQEYTVTVDEILDYLDPALTYLYCERADVDIKDLDENNNGLNQDNDTSSISRENANTKAERTFSKVLDVELKDCELNTVYGGKSENSNKSVVKVTASKVLSTDDDDLEFKNLAEIVKITTDKEGGELVRFMAPTDKERSDYKYKDLAHTIIRSDTLDVATITVTPPTGLKDNTIIMISIGIGLIIVISGIVIIKKKVL